MDDLNWQVIGFLLIALVCGGLIGYAISPSETNGLTNSEVNAKVSESVEQAIFQKNVQIETLEKLIEDLETQEIEDEVPEEKIEDFGYLVDELYLSENIEDVYSDREISTLFDGEIDFDGKDYDAEETLFIKDIKLVANENDFEGNVYMTLQEGAIEYKFEFENDLDTLEINEDETLVFNFLGKEAEISEWDGDEITISKGNKYYISEGESANGVILDMVMSDSVYIFVDGEGEKIYEGESEKVNGIEIKVKEVLYDSREGKISKAILVVGSDVEETYSNGEEYEEDSIWEWQIDANSIGIILNEEFVEIDKDGDEEFSAIGVENKLCLPNNYVCVRFNGMLEEDVEEYNLELDEKSGVDYVRIEGNFEKGTKDYDRVYVTSSGIFDRDFELIHATEIELANTDNILDISTGKLVFEDFEVNFDLDDAETNGNNLNSFDEKYTTNYGIIIDNVEDMVKDNEFTIEVSEERISGSISLI